MFILADDAGGDSSSVGDGGDDGEYIFFVRQHLVLVPISRCHSPPPVDSPPSRVAANRCQHRRRFTPNTMTRDAFRSPLTGAPRRAAKRWRSKNSRWMHLGAQEVMTRQILQQFWAQHSVLATNSYFLVGYALALWQSFVGPIPVAMQQMTDHLLTFWSGICPAE